MPTLAVPAAPSAPAVPAAPGAADSAAKVPSLAAAKAEPKVRKLWADITSDDEDGGSVADVRRVKHQDPQEEDPPRWPLRPEARGAAAPQGPEVLDSSDVSDRAAVSAGVVLA